MTFRLPVQISRVGVLCKPVSPDGLVSRLATRKQTIKKLILYQMKQNPSANLLKECKHKISYVPTRYNTTRLNINHSTTKQNTTKTVKQSPTKLIKDAEGSDYYKEMEKINIGPYFKRRPIKTNSKIKHSRTKCNAHTTLTKTKQTENYHEEIKVLDEKMNISTKPVISSLETDINNILPDTDLKIQNDIWKQSGLEILNNLNSKNSIWKFIYGKRKTIKHEFLQQKLVIKNKKFKNNKEQRIEIEEIKGTENPEEYIKYTSAHVENNAIPDILEPKNVNADSKLPLKLSTSKIFEQQSKPSNINVQIDPSFCKQNVIMATVNNRQLNTPNPEFMEQFSYNNSFYHINAMKDMENYNGIDMKYPKICYNAESDTYLLHNEIAAAENIAKTKETKSNPKIAKIIKPVVIKPSESDKKIKSITVRKLGIKKSTPKSHSLKTTNEGIIRQCSSNSICVSNLQSAKAANLMELNEAVSEKPNLAKIETPLSKKRDQKSRTKIKSSRLPKTLGEIYGVGKIRFLVEVSKPGHADHKQYLVVIQLPESKRDELSENNSPIPLNVNAEANDDSILSQQECLSNCVKETNPDQISTSKKNVSKVGSMIGLVKMKNKILPLLEINDYKGIEPLSSKISQLIPPKINKKDDDTEWGKKSYLEYRKKGQDRSQDIDEKQKISTFCNPPGHYNKDVHDQLQKIMNSAEYLKEQRKTKVPVTCKHIRQYSTCSRKNSTTKGLKYKILQKVRHTNRTVEFQQKRNLSYCMCSRCGQCPCICSSCPCSPCGWYPCNSCRPKCCPKFQLDYCCPRGRWDCSIPVPPCRKIEAPYPSYGESMPMWCKEHTECFDYEEHMLQPKNQTSQKIHLMEESIPKVTVVDPALQRKCCRDKWCEPYYPCVDQRICFYPYKVPVDYCCPRGRPHCYCWPERPCMRKPPPYRCFSDEDLEFPEVEVTEHDLARKFASDLYRRMGRKCRLPFTPACTVDCDLRSGEPRPVCSNNPKEACSTTCMPPNTYPACCTPVRVPPCQYPDCDTCINCCMPMEGIKKTRCSKKCCDED